MAKVIGPLLSFGASGTVAGLLTFNPAGGHAIARRRPQGYPAPSYQQQNERQRMRDAATSWHQLSQVDRDEWAALAAPRALTPFAKYWLEWQAQGSTPTKPPFIPMA